MSQDRLDDNLILPYHMERTITKNINVDIGKVVEYNSKSLCRLLLRRFLPRNT